MGSIDFVIGWRTASLSSKRIKVKKIVKYLILLLLAIIAGILSAHAIGRAANNKTPKGGINESKTEYFSEILHQIAEKMANLKSL